MKGQFYQIYYGPITSSLDEVQSEEYENYFKSLTPEYTDDTVDASSMITLQTLPLLDS